MTEFSVVSARAVTICISLATLVLFMAGSPGLHAAELVDQPRSVTAESIKKPVRPFLDRALNDAVPKAFPRPPSEWLTSEKAFYQKVLAGGRFDILLVPCQVQDWGLDQATRSYMTAKLSLAVAKAQAAKVADPYLVSKALGDGQRRLVAKEIYQLANAVGAKKIVWQFVGHNRAGKMAVTVAVQSRSTAAPNEVNWSMVPVAKSIEDISFDDQTPAIEAYEKLLPEIVSGMGLDSSALSDRKTESKLDIDALPASPMVLTTARDNPARDAYTFLLFGMMTPEHIAKTRQRFAEKAMLSVSRLAPSSPEYRVLLARAWLAMGFRPAAIRVLGVPRNDEEKEFSAVLNGNLPEVRAFAANEKNSLKRLLQKFDANTIAVDYGLQSHAQSVEEAKALNLTGEIWPFLAIRAFTDWDAWSQSDNAPLKLLLEREFPVPGFGLEEIMRGAIAIGDTDKLRSTAELSVFSHSRKFIEAGAAELRNQFFVDRPSSSDYMELLQAIGHDNLVRRIGFYTNVQGIPETGMAYANSIEAVYKGYPYYTLQRSKVESALAAKSSGEAKEGLLKSAYENAFKAMYWEQGQSSVSTEAFQRVAVLQRNEYGYFNNFYSSDIPFSPYYATWSDGGDTTALRQNNESALANSTSQLAALSALASNYTMFEHDEGKLDALFKSIDQRFIGSTMRGELLAEQEIRRGNLKMAETYYRQNMRIAPTYWKSFIDLGAILLDAGQVTEASNVFLSYPGFQKDSDENRVNVTSWASIAGSLFYQTGEFDAAQRLYQISASQGTGASREMTSAQRIKVIAGDLSGATLGFLEEAKRYNDPDSYRDYFGMLHATGHSDDAWAGFNLVVENQKSPRIWETALVGHHIAGTSESAVSEWVRQDKFNNIGVTVSYPATYLLRFATTDRIPSKDLPAMIDTADWPTWQLDFHSYVVQPGARGSDTQILGPVTPGGVLPFGVLERSQKIRVRSQLAYFAEAYRAIKLGEFSRAKSIFDDAAKFYDMSTTARYMLPYYALAAAKDGDTANIEKILSQVENKNPRFDFQLAKAVIYALSGKSKEALPLLNLARYQRPITEYRPALTQYTFGDICDLLFEQTKSEAIRDIAIDWAKKNEISEPWQSWSYALEAKLTTIPIDRMRAIAMAQYLDPKSERLSRFKKTEVDAAVKAYQGSNPFMKKSFDKLKENAV